MFKDFQTPEELKTDIKLIEGYKGRNWHEFMTVGFSEDIWVFGVTMYSLYAGLPLFALSSDCIYNSLKKIVVNFLKQCLHKDKGNRFATMT